MNSTETPGGSGVPAGWYDDPSGGGLRWWDGEQWTEHVHTAESAASAAGGTGSGSGGREGAPPRDLVKLREAIRARGTKTVGMFLGAIVLVVVVVALLVSGGSDDAGAGIVPGSGVPGVSGGPDGGARSNNAVERAARIRRQIQQLSKDGSDASKTRLKALRAQQRALAKAGAGNAQKQIEAAKKAAKAALESAE